MKWKYMGGYEITFGGEIGLYLKKNRSNYSTMSEQEVGYGVFEEAKG